MVDKERCHDIKENCLLSKQVLCLKATCPCRAFSLSCILIPVGCQLHSQMDTNVSTEYLKKPCTEQFKSDGGMVLWNEGRQKLYTASPSVIRRGLCMVRDQGKVLYIDFLFMVINNFR